MTISQLFDFLMEKERYDVVFVLSRYCYRVGLPTISDAQYAYVESRVRDSNYKDFVEYFNRSYDDDPVPIKLLNLFGIKDETQEVPNELYKYLEEEKSNSIRPVTSYEEAYAFACENHGAEMFFSLKLDGVNAKSLYLDNKLGLSLSRGRAGNSLNYTTGAKHTLPRILATDLKLEKVKVTGEFFVDKDKLSYLRGKYDSERYKTSKSSAISMLRVEHEPEDYSTLKFLAYCIDGIEYSSVAEEYKQLEELGFKTPPHLIATLDVSSLEKFKCWLDANVFDEFAKYSDLPSDGVVMEVNDLTQIFSEQNQYSARQIALKFNKWSFECIQGVITNIIIQQRRVYKSVRIQIEPIQSSDGCKAEFINSFNPGILIENDLYVGKKVWFERNAGAVNILIHGDRLKKLEGGELDGQSND